jgi:hypothetical protein
VGGCGHWVLTKWKRRGRRVDYRHGMYKQD